VRCVAGQNGHSTGRIRLRFVGIEFVVKADTDMTAYIRSSGWRCGIIFTPLGTLTLIMQGPGSEGLTYDDRKAR
jgi:hypothetical protein